MQRRSAGRPQPNRAKRMECVELPPSAVLLRRTGAPAFRWPNPTRQRQQAGRTPYASRQILAACEQVGLLQYTQRLSAAKSPPKHQTSNIERRISNHPPNRPLDVERWALNVRCWRFAVVRRPILAPHSSSPWPAAARLLSWYFAAATSAAHRPVEVRERSRAAAGCRPCA